MQYLFLPPLVRSFLPPGGQWGRRAIACLVVITMPFLVCQIACNRSQAPPRTTAANERQAILPADPILAEAAGRWGKNGQVVLTVSLQSNGSAILQIPDPGEGWRIEVRNAHVGNGRITYEQHYYVRNAPTHPLDGKANAIVFEPVARVRNKARLTSSIPDAEPVTTIVQRLE